MCNFPEGVSPLYAGVTPGSISKSYGDALSLQKCDWGDPYNEGKETVIPIDTSGRYWRTGTAYEAMGTRITSTSLQRPKIIKSFDIKCRSDWRKPSCRTGRETALASGDFLGHALAMVRSQFR